MALSKWKGKTALVTGASAGIGKEFARQLAEAGVNLVITARREDRLQELASQLQSAHGVTVDCVAADLSSSEGAAVVHTFTQEKGINVDILVNNAGFGTAGEFVHTTSDKLLGMVQVNIASLVELTHLYLPAMHERQLGYILLVGSVNAFMPVPHFAVYSATKAFVRSFGEALALECQGTGVTVSTVHPGGTSTEFVEVAEMKLESFMEKALMSPKAVAEIGLSATHGGVMSTVTGFSNKLTVFFLWLMPQFLVRLGAKALFSRLH